MREARQGWLATHDNALPITCCKAPSTRHVQKPAPTAWPHANQITRASLRKLSLCRTSVSAPTRGVDCGRACFATSLSTRRPIGGLLSARP
jgi:hypothetical protein